MIGISSLLVTVDASMNADVPRACHYFDSVWKRTGKALLVVRELFLPLMGRTAKVNLTGQDQVLELRKWDVGNPLGG